MDILITFNHGEDELVELPLASLAQFVLKDEGKPSNTEVSISFVANDTIAELNERFRGMEGPTDVLSFPMGENGNYDVNHETGAKILGDIVISVPKAMEQAETFGHSLQREVGFLTVHSMLHLLGYDHEEGGLPAVRMREKEETILTMLGIPRGASYVMEENE